MAMGILRGTMAALTIAVASISAAADDTPTSPAAGDAIFVNGFERMVWVQGYLAGYEQSLLPIGEIDFGAITHLMVSRERPLAGGTLSHDYDIDAVNGPIWAHSAVNAAHAAGRKAILMIGGACNLVGGVCSDMNWSDAASPAHRATFVANLLADVDAYGYDGLDLDWEPLDSASDRASLKALAQALRAARPNLLLTIPVGWFNPNYMTPDPYWNEIAPLFDRINVMTYDMAGSALQGWTGWKSWHNSALYNTNPPTAATPSAVDVSIRLGFRAAPASVPAAKLGMGVAFYGYCWRGVTGPGQTGGTTADHNDGVMSFANVVTQYPVATKRMWDATARVPYLSSSTAMGPQNCNFVSYDDEQSVAEKGAYARAQGLGSIIIWTVGQGHIASRPVGQRDPLLTALRNSLNQ